MRAVVVGESIAEGAVEVASAPVAGIAQVGRAASGASAGDEIEEVGGRMGGEVGGRMGDRMGDETSDEMGEAIDALSAALAGAGGRGVRAQGEGVEERSLPWELSAQPTLRAERRDAHRRTRRARRRRTVALAQSQLFGQVDG
jgi:hypothetical protein